ncbi:TraR/DksA family transcriptional regulator [Pseudomonas sp. Gutcm_11s]|uniref:TraR/DksA family transcriptional regulator n=1 Tax=Pseudomonas sp. Gutcm_11s TaxID=3026088 RepID=UPI00235EB1EC|nr:TraR/DksA C4-type zinc finger protein [Pseudomonas sp. Gutcm_11s]MDD0844500.1 TraR/DksA C4-type zinc finger protein [Pseudomonas sp. Gutcm_11s]
MTSFDPRAALDGLYDEYSRRANAIRHDLGLQRSADFAEQAGERQNDEVLNALLVEAEAGLRLVGLARLRLADGSYGTCQRCGEMIEPARLQALPAAEFCLACADRAPL